MKPDNVSGNGQTAGIVQGELALRQGKEYVGRIWLAGDPKATPISVSLVWGDDKSQRQTITVDPIGPDYAKIALQFTAGADTDAGRLEITASGMGSFHVGTVSLREAGTGTEASWHLRSTPKIPGLDWLLTPVLKKVIGDLFKGADGQWRSGKDAWRDGGPWADGTAR